LERKQNGNESLDYGRCSTYFVTPIPTLLHQKYIIVTYAGPSNFKMELVISMPLYFVAKP
jgi:hypothetical protein